LTRTINVDRRMAWRLWTESRHLAAWWGPHGFTNPVCSIDPTPGGRVHIVMRAPNDEEYLNIGTVRVADEPQATAGAHDNLAGMRDGWSESLERLANLNLNAEGATQ
jgi:Activator of Hsp90 ATPase homolog 1-like protein